MYGPAIAPAELPTLLSQLREGESGVIASVDLPGDTACRLMELGFVPGASVTAAAAAPGGDPRVYRVDGASIALRRETTRRMSISRTP